MNAPYSAPDLVARIMGGKRAHEIRRLGGTGLEADRIILAELRYIAATVAGTGTTKDEQRASYSLGARIRSSFTFASVSSRIRAAVREEARR